MKNFKLLFVAFIAGLIISGCKNESPDTIKLGATFPLTGEVASYGQSAKQGIELKIKEVNTTGGINGKKIEIDFQDDKNSTKDAVSIFNTFATINNYPVVFGSAGSSVTLALTPIANREKIVLISPVSSSSKLSVEGGDFFFRTVPSDNLQAEMLANWIYKDGHKEVAIVFTNNSWGKPLTDGFGTAFKRLGGKIVFNEGVQENITDFRTIIIKLKKVKFDAIFSPTYPKEGGQFVKQLKESGLHVQLYGGDNWGAPEFLEIAMNSANGAFFTFPAESTSPVYDDFKKRFHNEFNVDPDIVAAYGYDAATAVCEALKKVEKINAEEVRKALHRVSFQGVSDYITFKPNGDIKSDGYGKRKIEKGKIQILK